MFILIVLVSLNRRGSTDSLEPSSNDKVVHIAVASNFADTLRTIATLFEEQTEYQTMISTGSTGKLYAQIVQGGPYDVYLAADAERPQLLDQEEHAVPSSVFTYAIGQLVLWSPQEDMVDPAGDVLDETSAFRFLSIANPNLAPYGRAAKEFLQHRPGRWESLQSRMVRGENIGQAFQYVVSNNAEVGLIAFSQLKQHRRRFDPQSTKGSMWIVPQKFYTPITQQAALIHNSAAARAFLKFLQSPEARSIILAAGYKLPS